MYAEVIIAFLGTVIVSNCNATICGWLYSASYSKSKSELVFHTLLSERYSSAHAVMARENVAATHKTNKQTNKTQLFLEKSVATNASILVVGRESDEMREERVWA
jgi:methionine-rich copper-binding protein CopC